MSKADFVAVLKKNGLEAVEENGVVKFKRVFGKAGRLAR